MKLNYVKIIHTSWNGNRECVIFLEDKSGALQYFGIWESPNEFVRVKNAGPEAEYIRMLPQEGLHSWIEKRAKHK